MDGEVVLAIKEDGNHRVDGHGEEEKVGGDKGGGHLAIGQVEH